MVCTARLRARSPPRLSRCRTVRPLLAGSGLIPASAAKAASCGRAGVGVADDRLGGDDRAQSAAVGEAGGDRVGQLVALAPVGRQRPGGLAQRHAEPANLVVADGLLDGGVGGNPAPGQGAEGRVGQCGPAEATVAVRAVEQEGAEPVGLRGRGGSELLAGAEQDAQRFAGAVGAREGSRSASSCRGARTARWASITNLS